MWDPVYSRRELLVHYTLVLRMLHTKRIHLSGALLLKVEYTHRRRVDQLRWLGTYTLRATRPSHEHTHHTFLRSYRCGLSLFGRRSWMEDLVGRKGLLDVPDGQQPCRP